ncbi:MAG: Sugar ABC transporter permease [Xylanivirga thermophila]|jgi:raffinose/stachyose/melibiose transport system permease protein|uniref:carbohydrate ABC transporter permease n=1 Tax=Xylanivirga thermophila TaxID=2496273 RepID=UPI0039F5DEA1
MQLNKATIKKEIRYEFLLLPALVGYLIFFIYPTISSFVYSLTDWSVFSQEISFVGFKNFVKLTEDKEILIGIKNSIIYALLMTVLQNCIAIPLAVVLDRDLKTKNILRMIFFSPAVLSIMVVGYLWSYIMASTEYGLLNRIIQCLGFKKVNWLGDEKIALFSIVITQLWQWTGWAMVIYLANLQSIPVELYESAKIDGANGFQEFFRITLPLMVPSVSFNTIMSMIGGLKVFDIVFSMTSGGPGFATETITTVLIKRAFTEGFYGYACAYSVVFLLLIIAISSIQRWFLEKWEDKVS